MKENLGTIDRAARIIGGLALISLTLAHMIGVWGWIGIVPLVTGLMRSCPAYSLFGFNTCDIKRD